MTTTRYVTQQAARPIEASLDLLTARVSAPGSRGV